MKKIFLIFSLTALVLFSAASSELEYQPLIEAVSALDCRGVLLQTEEGFGYIKVDERFVEKTLEYLGSDSIIRPPYYDKGKVGAHITLFHASENVTILPEDQGKIFSFKPISIQCMDPSWEGYSLVYMIQVESKELERLRTLYNLPPFVKGRAFHITVGVVSQ